MKFRAWNLSENIEYAAAVEFQSGSPAVYHTNGISILTQFTVDLTTHAGRGESGEFVDHFELQQNYPNPFNPETRISYALPCQSDVSITVFSMDGRFIKTLIDESKPEGRYSVMWDATDERGSRVSAGIYLTVMRAGDLIRVRKIAFLK